MDMSIVFLFAMGFLICALVAELFQTVSVALAQRDQDKRPARK